MRFSFDRLYTLVAARCAIVGPAGAKQCTLALDTGSTYTVVAASMLRRAGYEWGSDAPAVSIITPNTSTSARRLRIERFVALGEERGTFSVLAYDFPVGMPVDGLLGPDFFRGAALTIDFANGFIELKR